MKTTLLKVLVFGVVFVSPAIVQAQSIGLTSSQVNAIISILQAFGAEQSIINNVKFSLLGTGSPTPILIPSTPGFNAIPTGHVTGTASQVLGTTVDVKKFGAKGDGDTDDTAAIQAAHDACPTSSGGCTVSFPAGRYLLSKNANYVFISKANVSLIGASGAEIVTPNCEDASVRTGRTYSTGFYVTGDNAHLSLNMCGAMVSWTPQTAQDRISLKDMTFRNMYFNGLAINNTAFLSADIDGVTFDTSRDMIADGGNYHAISRSSNGDTVGQTIRVNRSLFRGVAGGIDAHAVRNLEIGGGTRFEGCDIVCIKLSTIGNVYTEQNLVVDKSVVFNGACVAPGSANRHLACTGYDRVAGSSMYIGFMEVFNNVSWRATVLSAANQGVAFLNGVLVNSILNFDGAYFKDSPSAIYDAQGDISIRGARFESSNILWSKYGTPRRLTISDSQFLESYVSVTKKSSAPNDRFDVVGNEFSYSADDKGVIRFTDYGTDSGPLLFVDRNRITLSGGRTVAMDLGTSGTKGSLGQNNLYGSATIIGGNLPVPTLEFSITPTESVTVGERYSLTWSSKNTESCSLPMTKDGISQGKNTYITSGSDSGIAGSDMIGSWVFTLICTGSGGSVTKSLSLKIVPESAQSRNSKRSSHIAELAKVLSGPLPASNGLACVSSSCYGVWNTFKANPSVDSVIMPTMIKPTDPGDSTRRAGGYLYFDPSAWGGDGGFTPGYYLDWTIESVNDASSACTPGKPYGQIVSDYTQCLLKIGEPKSSASVSLNNTNQLASVASAFGHTPTQYTSTSSGSVASFSYTFTLDLYRGQSGAEVRALQKALKLQGLYSGDIIGNFYDQTLEAVKAFQTKYGINATGYVGPATRAKLNELYSK